MTRAGWNPKPQWFDGNGDPLSGGKVYSYIEGTTTPKDTYTDVDLLVANTNPIILNSRGECTMFLDGAYKFIVTDSDDTTIYTVDNIRDFVDPFSAQTVEGVKTFTSIPVLPADDPTTANQATRRGFVLGLVQGDALNFAADAEATDDYAITLSPAITAYATGQRFCFTANTLNTVGSTLNVNALGAKTITKAAAAGQVALETGDIRAGDVVEVAYNGTDFFMLNAVRRRIYIPHTCAISGEIKVADGDTDFINGMVVSEPSGQIVSLIHCTHKINGGTSATVKLQNNGVDITGYTAMSVTTTKATTNPATVALADGDVIAPVVTAVVGTPINMMLTIELLYRV